MSEPDDRARIVFDEVSRTMIIERRAGKLKISNVSLQQVQRLAKKYDAAVVVAGTRADLFSFSR